METELLTSAGLKSNREYLEERIANTEEELMQLKAALYELKIREVEYGGQ